MKLYTSRHETITLNDKPLASGGEGEIREVLSAPERFKNVCAKLYYQKGRTEQQKQKIKYMAANPPREVSGDGFMIGWPLDYITDANRNFMGFLMPLAFSNSIQLINLTTPRLPKNLSSDWFYRYDRNNGVSALLSRLKLINNIAIPVYLLHSAQRYVMKDFKPENVLVTANGKISMVDMDSIQIVDNGKLLFSGNAATPNYIPPEYYTNGVGKSPSDILDKSWDEFAIGVVFYQLLFGLHPYVVTPSQTADDSISDISQHISENLFPFGLNASKIASYPPLHNKFKKLPPYLQNLFLRSFASQASNRPTASAWGKTIHDIIVSAPKPAPPTVGGPQNPPPKTPPTPPSSKPKPTPTPSPFPKPKVSLFWQVVIILAVVFLFVLLLALTPWF